MKKLFLFALMCLNVYSMNAQRCAILEFKAGVGISQADVDGISAIFTTYFRPSGYTMVERTQIDRVIDEQGFQRSRMTESQMVRIGEILNVSKIVVGDVNIVMGQYNVDARVINVESGTIVAAKGATFNGSSYRTSMQELSRGLASAIAITSESTIQAQSLGTQRRRTTVEVIYGYLKIFPNEIGIFDAEPFNVIRQINNQAQYGYNNWRIPTNEELALLRANGYAGHNKYMTKESCQGIVLLVTDGKDISALQRAEEEIKTIEERRIATKKEKKARLIAQGYIDLSLPSGTWWKNKNENEKGTFISYDDATQKYGASLPTEEQIYELINECSWRWVGDGYKIVGSNGNSIFLPLAGETEYSYGGSSVGYRWESFWDRTYYWTSDYNERIGPIVFYFYQGYRVTMARNIIEKNIKCNIRLVCQP